MYGILFGTDGIWKQNVDDLYGKHVNLTQMDS